MFYKDQEARDERRSKWIIEHFSELYPSWFSKKAAKCNSNARQFGICDKINSRDLRKLCKHHNIDAETRFGKCPYCGRDDKMVIGTMIEFMDGGENKIDNYMISCNKCRIQNNMIAIKRRNMLRV